MAQTADAPKWVAGMDGSAKLPLTFDYHGCMSCEKPTKEKAEIRDDRQAIEAAVSTSCEVRGFRIGAAENSTHV